MRKAAPDKTTPPKTKSTAVAPKATETTPGKTNSHWNLRIPKLGFKDGSLNIYLVLVLLIFSFLLGMLFNKVMYLESQLKNGANAVAANGQNALPTESLPPQIVDVENGHLPVLGDENAKVTIVEFSDLQCPFCKSYVEETHEQIKEQYIDTGKVKFTFRHYPLTSIHPNAQVAAEASECANEQGKFWEYHDKLFAEQDTWSPLTQTDVTNSLVDYAGTLGMNTDQFRSCVESEKYKAKVEEDLDAGTQAQVDGTPAFFVNGYRLTGAQPFSEFQRVIDQELSR